MCPISVTDTSIHLIRKFASAELKDYLLPNMLSADPATMWKGTQFMTERAGGSDVGAIETDRRALRGRRRWRLYGDKWFCSHADADVALLLARPRRRGRRHQGACAVRAAAAAEGRQPQRLPHRAPEGQARHPLDGQRARSCWRARSPIWSATPSAGFKQMMEQVNLSRLSHGVRAAAMMRRCVNEAMVCARTRPRLRQDHHRLSAAAPPAC